jgi:hypothetical protein
MICHMQRTNMKLTLYPLNVSCIKFRIYFRGGHKIDFTLYTKPRVTTTWRESWATSQKLILWKASTACGFHQKSLFRASVDITLPHTARYTPSSSSLCKTGVFFFLRHTREITCTIFIFYAPNKTWNYFFAIE